MSHHEARVPACSVLTASLSGIAARLPLGVHLGIIFSFIVPDSCFSCCISSCGRLPLHFLCIALLNIILHLPSFISLIIAFHVSYSSPYSFHIISLRSTFFTDSPLTSMHAFHSFVLTCIHSHSISLILHVLIMHPSSSLTHLLLHTHCIRI